MPSKLETSRAAFIDSLEDGWWYYRGRLIKVEGEHTEVDGTIDKGHARMRYHKVSGVLAVQARTRQICRSAVNTYLDAEGFPDYVTIEWPGHFEDCAIADWK